MLDLGQILKYICYYSFRYIGAINPQTEDTFIQVWSASKFAYYSQDLLQMNRLT